MRENRNIAAERGSTPQRDLSGSAILGAAVGDGPRRLTPAEFAAEFTASSPVLLSIARAVIGNRTRAEDALQDAAVVGLQKLGEFEAGTSFLAWMGRIVRYVSLNELRKKRTHGSVGGGGGGDGSVSGSGGDLGEILPAPAESSAAPAELAVHTVSRAGGLMSDQVSFDDRVIRALGALEEAARSCLLMRVVHDLPYRDIAAILGIPEGTAMSHVHRAKRALREHLSKSASGNHAGRSA